MKSQHVIIKNEKKLSHWQVLLNQWVSLIKNYCDFMADDDGPTDSPYYYNERANIGILSAAAWKAGWIALEEFGCRKRGKEQARCDLYIYPRKSSKGKHIETIIIPERGEYIEAKILWSKFIKNEQAWSLNNVQWRLNEAEKDARSVSHARTEGAVKLGVLFIVPYIHKQFSNEINDYIQKLCKIVSAIPCDALAYSFPASVRELMGGGQFKHYIFPGIMLLAQLA